VFRQNRIEALLLADRVDERVVSHLPEFEGKPLVSVARGDLDLGALESDAEKAEHRKQADESKELIDRIKQALGERVKDVRATARLTASPACLVADAFDPGEPAAHPALGRAGRARVQPILEVNRSIRWCRMKHEESALPIAQLLLDQALLAEAASSRIRPGSCSASTSSCSTWRVAAFGRRCRTASRSRKPENGRLRQQSVTLRSAGDLLPSFRPPLPPGPVSDEQVRGARRACCRASTPRVAGCRRRARRQVTRAHCPAYCSAWPPGA
jgi:hypothetical protein